MPDYVVRPLTPEAQARLKADTIRQESNFSARWTDTEELLMREVRQAGCRFEFVIMVNAAESDIRVDGRLKANARPWPPAVAVAFHSVKAGDLLFTCGRFNDWRDNVRAIALGLESLRRVERYGIVQAAEQYRGWQALPPGATPMPPTMTEDEAERILRRYWHGAVSERQAWDVLYRRGAKVLHPDVGGDPDEFRRLTEARDLLVG